MTPLWESRRQEGVYYENLSLEDIFNEEGIPADGGEEEKDEEKDKNKEDDTDIDLEVTEMEENPLGCHRCSRE